MISHSSLITEAEKYHISSFCYPVPSALSTRHSVKPRARACTRHSWSKEITNLGRSWETSISNKSSRVSPLFETRLWHALYSAVILEGLRLSYGLATRLQRISPDEPLHFRSSVKSEKHESPVDYVIPLGTPVGMTSVLIHHNPDIFPSPLEFMPERWLDGSGQRTKSLNGFLLSFSKGTRQCLGIKYVKSPHWASQPISLHFNLLASAIASAVFPTYLGVSTNTPPKKVFSPNEP